MIKISCTSILIAVVLLGCVTTKKINDGTTAYDQKQYAVAIDMLNQEIRNHDDGEEYARISYLLGDSYRQLNDSGNSLKWFIEAAKNNYGPEAYWDLAYALKKNQRYADAILSFRRLAKYTDRQDEIRKEIEKCRKAQKWSSTSTINNYVVEAILLNSNAADYAPSLLGGNKIVFTSDRYQDDDDQTYNWTGNAFSDLYISDVNIYNAEPLIGVNTEHNEGTAVFNLTGDIMYFTRCDSEIGDSYCKIYKSVLEGGEWTKGSLAFPPRPSINYRDPVLIENDSVLIFVSDDPTGVGGSDLYYSFLLEDGNWDVPSLMPSYLNSIGEERFPTWDGTTLYFSSDHFAGLGGLDIFKTTLREDGSWTRPLNLLKPFNSSEDDYSYLAVAEKNLEPNVKSKKFFTSTRGAFGNDDIYEAVEYKTEEEMSSPPTTDTIVIEEIIKTKSFFLRVSVVEKVFAMVDNPNSLIVGNKGVAEVSIKINDEILLTDNNGVVIIPISSDTTSFIIVAGKNEYLNNRITYTITEAELDTRPDRYVFEQELEIEKLFEGVEITLDNIYYDFNEAFIREDAKPALDQLITILKNNVDIDITLASHTDCRGDDDYNQDLSHRRAVAAVEYINKAGSISSERLSAIGYGARRLELDCDCDNCSEDEHQVNRRTTFTINK